MTTKVRKPLFPNSPDDIILACYLGQPTSAKQLSAAFRALRIDTAESAFIRDGARRVITEHWKSLAVNNQGRWAYLFGEGLVDSEMADAWADDVWPAEADEDDDQEDDDDEASL